MGLSLPTMLRAGYSRTCHGCDRGDTLGRKIIPPSIVLIVLLQGTLAGDLYSWREASPPLLGCLDALTYLGSPAVLSVGTFNQQRCCLSILRLAFSGRGVEQGGAGMERWFGHLLVFCDEPYLGVVVASRSSTDNY
jgi:hypothetical protein